MRVIHPVVYVLLSTKNNFSIKGIRMQGDEGVKNPRREGGEAFAILLFRFLQRSFLAFLFRRL